jgi:hypothetical protein
LVIGALGKVSSLMSPLNKDVHTAGVVALPVISHVRIKRLASLCTLRLSVNLDELSVTLLSKESLTCAEKMHPMLRSYIERVRRRGTYSRAVHTAERLTIQRMRTLGIDVAVASAALRGIRSVMDINRNYDTNELILENIEELRRASGNRNAATPEVRSCEPLLSATLSGLHLNHYALTYDSKTSFFVEELVVVDQDSHPVLHAFCENQGHFDCLSLHSKVKVTARERAKHRRQRKSAVTKSSIETMAKQLESSSIASYSAIAIVYLQQDAVCSWGSGGHPSSVLYERYGPQHVSKRHHKCSVSFKNVDVILAPNGIPKIISNALPIVGDLYERCSEMMRQLADLQQQQQQAAAHGHGLSFDISPLKKRMKRPHPKERTTLLHSVFSRQSSFGHSNSEAFDVDAVLQSAELQVTYDVSVGCAHVVCSAYEDLLAECALHKVRLECSERAGPVAAAGGGAKKEKEKTASLAVEDFELHDLSEPGSKHPSIMWRERKSTKDIITVAIVFEDKGVDLTIDIEGLRLMYLARFVADVTTFLNDHFISLIRSSFTSLHSAMDKVADRQRGEQQFSAEDLASLGSVSSSSDGSGEESSEEDIAGNAFFEYPMPDLDPDAILEECTEPPSPRSALDSAHSSSHPHLLRTLHHSILPISEEGGAEEEVHLGSRSLGDMKQAHGPSGVEEPATSGTEDSKTTWRLQLTNFNLIFPRNSASDDLLALRVGQLLLFEKLVAQTWEAPGAGNPVQDEREAYYYCMDSDEWRWSARDEEPESFLHECSVSSFGDLDLDNDPLLSPGQFSQDAPRSAGDRGGGCLDRFPLEVTVLEDDEDEYFSSSSSGEDDDDEFKDTFQEEFHSQQSFLQSSPLARPPLLQQPFSRPLAPAQQASALPPKKKKPAAAALRRHCAALRDLDLFCSVAGPASTQSPPVRPHYDEHRRLVELRAGRPVYSIVHHKRAAPRWSSQLWNKVSATSVNVGLVLDHPKDAMRVLLCETSAPSVLHLKVSMAEFYLLQSIYFDNMQETGAFFLDAEMKRKLSVNRDSIIDELEASPGGRQPQVEANAKSYSVPFPEYGTLEFWVHMRRSIPNFEFMVVRSKVCVECAMDTNYFPHEITSLQYLATKKFPYSQFDVTGNRRIPFASLELKCVSLHVMSSDQVMQVALGSAGLTVKDLRGPLVNCAPTIFDLSPSELACMNHGYADFDYGLKEGPYSLNNAMDIPVKLTYFCGNNWKTVNVGLDTPNLNMKNFDIIWLLTDFFSCYNSYSEFGNPSVIAFNLCAPPTLPYGGLDSRIFIKKPHIQTRESNVDPEAQMLFIEADTGIFVRYMYDTLNSARVEVLAQDVSVVLMQSYSPPAACRGVRGTTGSGHGTRTILEYFTVSYSNQYDHTLNQVDNLLAIVPSSRDSAKKKKEKAAGNGNNNGNTDDDDDDDDDDDADSAGGDGEGAGRAERRRENRSYINFDDDSLVLPSCSVNSPKCVSALAEPSRDFPVHCCSVVSSYQDLLFAGQMLTEFVGMEEQEEGGGGGGERAGGVRGDEAEREVDDDDDDYSDDDGDDEGDEKGDYGDSVGVDEVGFLLECDNILGCAVLCYAVLCHATRQPIIQSCFWSCCSCLQSFVDRGLKGTSAKKKVPQPERPPPAATFAIIRIQAVKTTIVDHILGLHLPLAQVRLHTRPHHAHLAMSIAAYFQSTALLFFVHIYYIFM